MFLGRYDHTIDEKGRLTIPVRFRPQLEGGAFLTRGFDRNLLVLTPETFETLSQAVKQMSITADETRQLRRLIFANAEAVEMDRSGRILIPQWLREAAGISSAAILVGAGEYLEVWAPENWAAQDELLLDSDTNSKRFGGLNLPV